MRRPSPFPLDTSPEACRVQFDVLRKLGLEGRAALTIELSDNLREVLADGVRHRQPELTESQVRMAVLRLTLGEALFKEAFPQNEVSEA